MRIYLDESSMLYDQFCRLSCCGVTEEGGASLASALRSNPSTLRELDLRNNDLQIPEMQLLSDLQWNPLCKLATLRSVSMFNSKLLIVTITHHTLYLDAGFRECGCY